LSVGARRNIGLERVRRALSAVGQSGSLPEHIGEDRVLGPSMMVKETNTPGVRFINAAVLALLFEEAGEARLVFTRRSASLRSHRGEVSFAGGRLDEGEGPQSAALREAYEEMALDPELVFVEGWIHPVLTMVSGSLIAPIVASVERRPDLVASPAEVERVFDVALCDLADPEIFHEERWQIPGQAIPGSPDNSFAVWFFEVEGEMIWGATARMIHELLSVVLVGDQINDTLKAPKAP